MRIERPREQPLHEEAVPVVPSPQSGEWGERTSGISRTTARPSAFGPPRHVGASHAMPSDETLLPTSAEIGPAARPPAALPVATPMSFSAVRQEASLSPPSDEVDTRSITTDIEQLLPLNLPKPPPLPAFDEQPSPPVSRKSPWASVGVFACALVASTISLVHYARHAPEHAVDAKPAERLLLGALAPSLAVAASAVPPVVGMPLAPRPEPMADDRGSSPEHHTVRRLEEALAGSKKPLDDALFERGIEALGSGDERLAESLFGRLIDRNPKSADGAFGLARVRIAQNDLEAAEGWIRLAIAERPRDPAYRLLHADLLQRTGQLLEAQAERAHARMLEKH